MSYFWWLDREQHLAARPRLPDEVCPDCGGNPCGCPEQSWPYGARKEVTGEEGNGSEAGPSANGGSNKKAPTFRDRGWA